MLSAISAAGHGEALMTTCAALFGHYADDRPYGAEVPGTPWTRTAADWPGKPAFGRVLECEPVAHG